MVKSNRCFVERKLVTIASELTRASARQSRLSILALNAFPGKVQYNEFCLSISEDEEDDDYPGSR